MPTEDDDENQQDAEDDLGVLTRISPSDMPYDLLEVRSANLGCGQCIPLVKAYRVTGTARQQQLRMQFSRIPFQFVLHVNSIQQYVLSMVIHIMYLFRVATTGAKLGIATQ